MEVQSPGDAPPALLKALRQVLRPLVRLLLKHQITYTFLSDFLKGIFVDVAERESAREGIKATDSRIHLLTGVHRKDVRRIRNATKESEEAPRAVSLAGQVIARWTGDDRFVDAAGLPAVLPRVATGKGPSFEELVNSVSRQDVHPGSVFSELVRLGVVAEEANGMIRLAMEAFVPDKDFENKAYYFGQNIRDHIASAARNLGGEAAPLLERSVYYNGLSAMSVDELEKLSRTLGMEVLQKVNRKAMALQRADRKSTDAVHRINFGVFFYEEEKRQDDK